MHMVLDSLIVWLTSILQTAGPFAYLAVFLASLVNSMTIVVALVPLFLFVLGSAAVLNPWLVGLVAGAGASIGELTAYAVGAGGNYLLNEQQRKWFGRLDKMAERYGAWFVIFLFAATPLPFDVAGVFGGIIRYDLKKFYIATLAGKIVYYTYLSLGVCYGVGFITGSLYPENFSISS